MTNDGHPNPHMYTHTHHKRIHIHFNTVYSTLYDGAASADVGVLAGDDCDR